MTTVRETVQDALREGNIVPVGSDVPDREMNEGVRALNRILVSAFGSFSGGALSDWLLPCPAPSAQDAANAPLLPGSRRDTRYRVAPQFPPTNSRVVWDGTDQTFYMPSRPDDGARMAVVTGNLPAAPGELTVLGNGRLVELPADPLVSTVAVTLAWFYRADTATWRLLKTLGVDDEIPFPPTFDDLWITGLAVRMYPRYGKVASAETLAEFQRVRKLFYVTYHQAAVEPSGADDLVPGYASYDQLGLR